MSAKEKVRMESQAKGIILMNVKRCELHVSCKESQLNKISLWRKGVLRDETSVAQRIQTLGDVLTILLKSFQEWKPVEALSDCMI